MTEYTIDNTYTVQNTATTNTMYNLYLFAMRSTNTATLNHLATTKIYYCKIWDNDMLVRNFVPCINDNNIIGLYDSVNSVFYSPSGTGAFRGGAEIPKPNFYIRIENSWQPFNSLIINIKE